jgi:hypothetical protein
MYLHINSKKIKRKPNKINGKIEKTDQMLQLDNVDDETLTNSTVHN